MPALNFSPQPQSVPRQSGQLDQVVGTDEEAMGVRQIRGTRETDMLGRLTSSMTNKYVRVFQSIDTAVLTQES